VAQLNQPIDDREQLMNYSNKRPGTVALVLAGVMLATGGCVLIVDGEGGKVRRADVEWESNHRQAETVQAGVADGTLAREVESRIRLDDELAREDITVSSTGDIVTLHGRLSKVALLERALRIASEVQGVSRVVSRLTVEMEAG
jgi:osmotically-inducible protein OsmY